MTRVWPWGCLLLLWLSLSLDKLPTAFFCYLICCFLCDIIVLKISCIYTGQHFSSFSSFLLFLFQDTACPGALVTLTFWPRVMVMMDNLMEHSDLLIPPRTLPMISWLSCLQRSMESSLTSIYTWVEMKCRLIAGESAVAVAVCLYMIFPWPYTLMSLLQAIQSDYQPVYGRLRHREGRLCSSGIILHHPPHWHRQ